MDIQSDRDLVRALSSKDTERAVEQILDKHGPMVMGVCRRMLGNHHDAEDAFQAAFIVLVRRRQSLTLTKSLGGWLHGVAFRTAMKAKTMRSKPKAESPLPEGDLESRETEPADRVVWAEIGRILDEEIQQLPEIMRAAIILCDLEGRSHKDAAAELGIPPGTLSGRLIRAREKIRRRLTRRGLTITTAGLTAAISAHASATDLAASQVGGALQTARLVLAGKSTSLTTAATFALALANAAGGNRFLAKTLAASSKGVSAVAIVAVALVGLAVAAIFRTPPSADAIGGAQFADPLITAERAVMQLGEQAFRHRDDPTGIAFLPDGKRLATISSRWYDRGIYLWDVSTGRKLWELPASERASNWPTCLAAPPSGNILAVGRNNGEVNVLDADTGRSLLAESLGEQPVTAVAFSPDGDRLVAGNADGVILVLSTSDHDREIRSWTVPVGRAPELTGYRVSRAYAIAVSPEGERIAVADNLLGAVHVFLADSGELLTTIEETHRPGGLGIHDFSLRLLKFTPNGRHLISNGYRMVPRETTTIDASYQCVQRLEARLWDVNHGALVRELIDEDIWGIGVFAFSSDCENFATVDSDALRFWRRGEGTPRREIPMPVGALGQSAAFSPDGNTVAVATGNGITLWDGERGTRVFHEGEPRYSALLCVAWSNQTDKLALGYSDGVELRDAATGTLQYRFEMGEPGVEYSFSPSATSVAFSSDGRLLVSAGKTHRRTWPSDFGIIKVWDVISGDELSSIPVERPVWNMALADDASVVAVTTGHGGDRDTQLSVYELPSGELLSRFPEAVDLRAEKRRPGFQRALAARIPPGSTKVYLACEDGHCFHWDFKHHRQSAGFFADQRTDENAGEVLRAAFSPDGETLVTAGPHLLCVWNTDSETLEHTELVPIGDRFLDLGISADGRRVVGTPVGVAGFPADNAMRIWDLPSRTLELEWQPANDRATSFAFSPDNAKLLTGLDRGTAVIWDVRPTPANSDSLKTNR